MFVYTWYQSVQFKIFNMCFALTPPQEPSSEVVFNMFILDEDRDKVENHLRLVNDFINIQLEVVESAPGHFDEDLS